MTTSRISTITPDDARATGTHVASAVHEPVAPDSPWWRHAVIYQVYPRSFADSDGDGVGDLRGVTAHLDHLVALGVDAVWLSPFYRSPQRDAGYDVADHRDVDPLFGSLADADELIDAAHARGIRIVVDLVPNHTSDQHPWLVEALAASPGSAARARYLFREGSGEHGELPPNNWQSIFDGPGWTRLEDGQWYLHMFDSSQPDLNWDNPEVGDEFESVLRFWLDRDVDGFRVDVAHGMVKAPGLPDWDGHVTMVEGAADVAAGAPEDGSTGAGNTGPMFDQEGVHDIYRRWREVLDEYDGDRALVAEAWVEPLSRLARYVRPDEMNQAFNFSFLTTPWQAERLRGVVEASLRANAADVEATAPGSTLQMYRSALRLRREASLGTGSLTWEPAWSGSADVVALRNREVVVLGNLGTEPVKVPNGAEVLVASGPLVGDESGALLVPTDTTVWFRA